MASDFETERSPEARSLAEQTLLRLLVALEGNEVELVVLGGLVPEILTRGQVELIPTHLGTTDVDIHVSFGVDADRDLGSLEHALETVGAEPDPKIDGWRWRIPVGDVRVKIEFLCDRNDVAADQSIALPGCRLLTAANLRGTGFVARDWVEEELTGTIDGDPVTVTAKYAGLEGYLMAKAHAVRHRGLDRDCYDLVFVLIYNRAGGPGQAAELLRSGSFAEDVASARTVWHEIEARFAEPSSLAHRATQHRQFSSISRPTALSYARAQSALSPNSSAPSASISRPRRRAEPGVPKRPGRMRHSPDETSPRGRIERAPLGERGNAYSGYLEVFAPCSGDGFFDRHTASFACVLEGVLVGAGGESGVVVAELFCDLVDDPAAVDQQRGAGVAEVVRPEVLESDVVECLPPGSLAPVVVLAFIVWNRGE